MDRLYSVIEGRDPDVLDSLFGFYRRPEGKVVDLTCNRRKMWKGLCTENVVFCDIDPSVKPDVICDCSKTPFNDSEISVIVYDPPHLPSAAGTDTSLPSYVADYGLKHTVSADNISSIFEPFLVEAKRILVNDGLVFVKLSDFVHNHRYQWTLVDFINAVQKTDGLTATDLIIKRDPCAGNLKSGKWIKSHHARRAHCWWIVVRKGKCEPRKDYQFISQIGWKLNT